MKTKIVSILVFIILTLVSCKEDVNPYNEPSVEETFMKMGEKFDSLSRIENHKIDELKQKEFDIASTDLINAYEAYQKKGDSILMILNKNIEDDVTAEIIIQLEKNNQKIIEVLKVTNAKNLNDLKIEPNQFKDMPNSAVSTMIKKNRLDVAKAVRHKLN